MLAQTVRVAIVLDRRIDPARELKGVFENTTLGELLDKLAADQGLGVSLFNDIVYLGPPRVAHRLRTLAALERESLAHAPTVRKRVLLEARPMRWAAGSTPQSLLAELEKESGMSIENKDRVPHDLWRAGDLPPLAWIDRLLLVCRSSIWRQRSRPTDRR